MAPKLLQETSDFWEISFETLGLGRAGGYGEAKTAEKALQDQQLWQDKARHARTCRQRDSGKYMAIFLYH
eukprot:1854113-Amphidinium_carterae.1